MSPGKIGIALKNNDWNQLKMSYNHKMLLYYFHVTMETLN